MPGSKGFFTSFYYSIVVNFFYKGLPFKGRFVIITVITMSIPVE